MGQTKNRHRTDIEKALFSSVSVQKGAFMELKVKIFQGVGKGVVDGFICLLCLFPHIAGHITFVGASALFLLPFFKGRKLFLVAAGADEALRVALSDQLHLLVADGAAGVRAA